MKVTLERDLAPTVVARLYPMYAAAFGPLRTRAAARHVLTAEEFAAEMTDARIDKYVVWDDDGEPVALSTVATDLAAVPWISAEYFTSRYPEDLARGSLWYLGYLLVDPTHRNAGTFMLLAHAIVERLIAARAVCGYDVCTDNDATGIGRQIAAVCRLGRATFVRSDAQHYYVADFRGAPAAGPTVAAQTGAAPTGAAQTGAAQTGADPAAAEPMVVTLADRPDLAAAVPAILDARWPAFMLAGQPGHDVDLVELVRAAPEHQVMLVDAADTVLAVGISVPVRWDGTVDGLPAGWDDAVDNAADLVGRGGRAEAYCALSVTIAPAADGRGLAGQALSALRRQAATAGVDTLIVPVRPVLKSRYPLIPIERYLGWRTDDGRVFDPWLRLHLRAGGIQLGLAPTSMTVTGSVAQWRDWVDLPLPASGKYVIPGGLVPLVVDAEAGTGTYREPNVWVAHSTAN